MRHAKKLLKLVIKLDDILQNLHDTLRDLAYEEEENVIVKPTKKNKSGRPKKYK